MSFDANNYNVTVRRVVIDGAPTFEATVLELPDVRGYGETAADAHSTAVEAIEALQGVAARDNDEFPAPFEPEAEYSGRITLRMPKSVHRAVALKALGEEMSVNSYILATLSISLSDYARNVMQPRNPYYMPDVPVADIYSKWITAGQNNDYILDSYSNARAYGMGALSQYGIALGDVVFGSGIAAALPKQRPDTEIHITRKRP